MSSTGEMTEPVLPVSPIINNDPYLSLNVAKFANHQFNLIENPPE